MTLEEQLKDLQEKLDMTQAIKHGGIEISAFVSLVKRKGEIVIILGLCFAGSCFTFHDWN